MSAKPNTKPLTKAEVETWLVDPKWDSALWFYGDMKVRVLDLLAQRDELLLALEKIAGHETESLRQARTVARAAIARARSGKP